MSSTEYDIINDLIADYPEGIHGLGWNYETLSDCRYLSLETIENLWNKLDIKTLSANPALTTEFIKENIGKLDYDYLHINPNILPLVGELFKDLKISDIQQHHVISEDIIREFMSDSYRRLARVPPSIMIEQRIENFSPYVIFKSALDYDMDPESLEKIITYLDNNDDNNFTNRLKLKYLGMVDDWSDTKFKRQTVNELKRCSSISVYSRYHNFDSRFVKEFSRSDNVETLCRNTTQPWDLLSHTNVSLKMEWFSGNTNLDIKFISLYHEHLEPTQYSRVVDLSHCNVEEYLPILDREGLAFNKTVPLSFILANPSIKWDVTTLSNRSYGPKKRISVKGSHRAFS